MKSSTKKVLIGLGIGCSVLIAIAVIGLVILGYYAKRTVEDLQSGVTNPGPKALKSLGAEEFPPGFAPHLAFNIPFFMDFVMLKELKPGETLPQEGAGNLDESGNLDLKDPESGMVYVNMIRLNNSAEAESYIRGEAGSTDALREAGINIQVDQQLNNGNFQIGDTTFYYTNHVGDFEMSGMQGAENASFDRIRGIGSLIMADCPNDDRFRIFYWFGKSESLEVAPGETIDLTGTGRPGDPERMQEILNYFALCK